MCYLNTRIDYALHLVVDNNNSVDIGTKTYTINFTDSDFGGLTASALVVEEAPVDI